MTYQVETQRQLSLGDYEGVAQLSAAVRDLRTEAGRLVRYFQNRRVWMVSSTPRGGGVAEQLLPLVSLMCEFGVDTRWLVMEPDEPDFFRLTKRLHNLIHGQGDPDLSPDERQLYERVSRDTADALRADIAPGDVVVIHDPQPLGAGAMLRESMDITAIWQCHIGLDQETPQTRAAWAFLGGYAQAYDRAVFSAPQYIPGCVAGRAMIIHPAIDPLSHKNRDLPVHKLVGILTNANLVRPYGPVLTPAFPEPARRLEPDGSWAPATAREDIGLLFRPIVTQVSRWDRLKGFLPLMRGFIALKQGVDGEPEPQDWPRRALHLARLVLAGPDPGSIADDPEAQEVLAEIGDAYVRLEPDLQEAVVILSLPMGSQKYNALMVNALQRCSDVVVQNSLSEGFGLTATEAMWKQTAVMGSRAVGLRQQIRPGLDGCLVENPEDPAEIAHMLGELLRDQPKREALARSAQQRVYDEFLIFTQIRHWLELISDTVKMRQDGAPRAHSA
ncbi:glycosyltransferase [Caulobacter sp. LARHSG274]